MESVSVYISKNKLVIVKWRGKWNADDYFEEINTFLNNVDNIKLESAIHDISDLDFTFKMKDIKKIVEIKKKYIKSKHSTVYITNKPQDVVFAQLFADEFKEHKIYHCATIDRAINLLGLDNDYLVVKEAYINLKF